MFFKGIRKLSVYNIFGLSVEIHHIVQSNTMGTDEELIYFHLGNESAGSTDSYNSQGSFFILDHSCFKINIYQSIKLIENNVYIIRSDSGGNHTNSLSFISSCMGNKFSVCRCCFDGIKIL